MQTLWTPDVVWHVGGGRLAGDYQGSAAILGMLGDLAAAAQGTLQVELQSVLADDDQGFSLQRATAEKGGETYELWAVLGFRFVDGKMAEVWSFEYDQAATTALVG